MSAAFDDEDVRILSAVRGLWSEVDPVPARLGDRVKYAMTVRMLEAEIAELTRMPELAARAEPAEVVRSLSFAGSRLSLMVTVNDEGEQVRVDGWVTRGGALVELHVDGQVLTAVADETGRVVFTGVPSGTAHFILWADQTRVDRPTITPAFDL